MYKAIWQNRREFELRGRWLHRVRVRKSSPNQIRTLAGNLLVLVIRQIHESLISPLLTERRENQRRRRQEGKCNRLTIGLNLC